MFTLEQIQQAHSKVKSGADFPAYIQELIELGVINYVHHVADGSTVYSGRQEFTISSGAQYHSMTLADQPNADQFQKDLQSHQQGKTTYADFTEDCAKSGVDKWIISMDQMSCTYFDKKGNEMLKENIPQKPV